MWIKSQTSSKFGVVWTQVFSSAHYRDMSQLPNGDLELNFPQRVFGTYSSSCFWQVCSDALSALWQTVHLFLKHVHMTTFPTMPVGPASPHLPNLAETKGPRMGVWFVMKHEGRTFCLAVGSLMKASHTVANHWADPRLAIWMWRLFCFVGIS